MSVAEEIFPDNREERFVQTEWAPGWAGITSGYGYAAEFLTERARELDTLIDYAGLAIFYLQRHRVEALLKLLVSSCGADPPRGHDLRLLWSNCRAAVRARTGNRGWLRLEPNSELIAALSSWDESSQTFRYPIDARGNEHDRPLFIDLQALQRHVKHLNSDVYTYLDHLWELETEERR